MAAPGTVTYRMLPWTLQTTKQVIAYMRMVVKVNAESRRVHMVPIGLGFSEEEAARWRERFPQKGAGELLCDGSPPAKFREETSNGHG